MRKLATALGVLAMGAALALSAACSPMGTASCAPTCGSSTGPVAPAPVIDAGVPSGMPQPASPVRHEVVVKIFVEDPHGDDGGTFIETHTVTYLQPPDGVVLSNGVPTPYTHTSETPVALDLSWEDGIPGVTVKVTADAIPSGYTLACQVYSPQGQPLSYPPPTTAPLDPNGFYRLTLVCPVNV